MAWVKYTDQQISDAVRSSHSYAGVIRALGMGRSGSNTAHIKNRIERLELDVSHFTGQGWSAGAPSRNRKSAEEILVYDPSRTTRIAGKFLKRSLLELGVPYQCALGKGHTVWMGRAIRLEVDHIDGNFLNNTPENLRLLCPNCHSQQETSSGRY